MPNPASCENTPKNPTPLGRNSTLLANTAANITIYKNFPIETLQISPPTINKNKNRARRGLQALETKKPKNAINPKIAKIAKNPALRKFKSRENRENLQK